ncbi:hypothetical protein FJY63_04780, partial [Candidatus Sumerlaeota bacterium]|nr:hypothetical protein [Candidatus Sumerlaeota bacterium]
TLNFLAECDAALFLVSADPPLTEVEVEFLKKVRAKVAKVFFVLNKVDYLSVGDCQDALEFLRDVLSEHAAVAGGTPIFATSALQGLRARETSDRALWVRIASQIKLPGEPADLGI